MTFTIDLPSDLANDLERQACTYGLSLNEFVMQVMRQQAQARVAHEPGLNIPIFDPYLDKAGERIKAAAQKAYDLGLVDDKGNLLSSELPPDMQEESGLDFGG